MHNRWRLLQGANALLYFGPLLAGLGGYGWAVAPVFAAIFVLWLIILRPREWPRRMTDALRPNTLVSMASRIVSQMLLVALLFAIGRGIGGVFDLVKPFHVMLPIGVSFLSIPLARMIWDPWTEGAAKAMQPMPGVPAAVAPSEEDLAAAEAMVAAFSEVPEDATDAQLRMHLKAMASHLAPGALHAALTAAARDKNASPVLRRANSLLSAQA